MPLLDPLKTCDQHSSADHCSKTPCTTDVLQHPEVPQTCPKDMIHMIAKSLANSTRPMQGPSITSSTKHFIPSPPSTIKKPLILSGPPTNRDLSEAFQHVTTLLPYPGMSVLPFKKFDPVNAIIHTSAGHHDAADVLSTAAA